MNKENDLIKDLAKEKLKNIVMLVMGIVILILLVFSFIYGRKIGKADGEKMKALMQEKTQITEDVLHQQLESIGELNTAKYYYTNMGRYKNTLAIKGQTIPFTTKSFIITYDGIIKAGVEIKEIKFELKDKTILITIPKGKVLSHEMLMDSVQVFDEKNSIFNGLSTEDVTNFQQEQKDTMEQKAIINGLLEEATSNTKDCLKAIYQVLLSSDDYEDGYVLEFVEAQHEKA